MDFVEKYRPRTLSEVRGNHKAIEELRKWALDWPSEKTTALLYGKPGTGKTSAALALANDMGWQPLELNASDKRTQGAVNAAVGAASRNASLQSARKLILLDEIDNLHGSADRGGAKAVTELVKKTREPVILTANELHGVSSTLRSYCKLIAFFAVREESAQKALVDIWHNERREVSRAQEAVVDMLARLEQPVEAAQDAAELEQLHADLEVLKQTGFDLEWRTVSDDLQAVVDLLARLEQPVEAAPDAELERLDADVAVLVHSLHDLEALRETLSDVGQSLNLVDMVSIQQIVKNARGDLRSAINDFQAYVGGAEVETASRDRVQSPFDLLRSIFGDKDPMASLTVSYSLDQTPEDLIHWVDENLPRSLKGAALAHAFQVLRRADTCLGRTRKRQNYGLWRYAAELMTSGVNVVSNQSSSQRNLNAKYSPPTHWMRLGQTRAKRAVRDAVATKIGATTHISINKARQDAIPLYKEIAERDPAGIMTALHLNADELAYLMNVKKDSQVVKSAFKEAEQLNKTETLVRQTAPQHPMQAGSGGTRSRSETRLQNGSGNHRQGPRQDTSKPAAQREQRSLKEY